MFRKPSISKKTALVAVLSLCALLFPAGQAGANALFTGACAVRVRVDFASPGIRLSGTSPNYNISLEGAVDLDPLSSGTQACAITFDTLEPLRRTAASGSGNSTFWSCTSVVASGSWNQSFVDRNGQQSPSPVFGSHSLFGTWDAWTLEVTSPGLNFIGVAELTLDGVPQNQKVTDCPLSSVQSLTMIGTMVFQDP